MGEIGHSKLQKHSSSQVPTYLTPKEVAELLKVRPRTIYAMVAQNRIPYHKPPGSNILRFDLEEILEWMKAGVKA